MLGIPGGPDLGKVKNSYKTLAGRAVYYEWTRDPSKNGIAVEIVSRHIIAGSDQKQFLLSYYNGTLPKPY